MKVDAKTIYGFVNAVLASRFDLPHQTPECHMQWWELMCDPHPKVALAAPRGHAKSTAITHSYTLAMICFRERNHVMIVSDTETQAKAFLLGIKTELLENELLINGFKFKRLTKDTETELIGEFEDGHKFRVIARGTGQASRGLTWRNKRPDLVIGDDLENDEMVLNEERREKARKWIYNTLLPIGNDNCIFRFVGTILHLDSVLERLMPKLGASTTVDAGLYQYSIDPNASWKSYRYKAHTEDYSEILWPSKFSKERLEAIRRDYIEQGNPEGYAQEYLNYPIAAENAFFRKTDFDDISDDDSPEEYYIGVDMAISEKDKRAYSVFVVAGVTDNGILRIRDVIRERMDSLEIVDTLFLLNQKWQPEVFFIESENIAKSLGPVIEREMGERDEYFTIEQMPPIHDKLTRARPLQARMRAGMVEMDHDAPWFPAYQQEFLQFPSGAYKDQVDATAWIAHGLRRIVDAPTAEEILEMAFEDEMNETMSFTAQGRSSITGY